MPALTITTKAARLHADESWQSFLERAFPLRREQESSEVTPAGFPRALCLPQAPVAKSASPGDVAAQT